MANSGFLKWDSEFFNKQIAFIDGLNTNYEDIIQEINLFFEKGTECIYLFCNEPIHLANYDYILADKKRTYVLKDPKIKIIEYECHLDTPLYKGQPADLYNLALQSGEHSRFKIDPHFSEEEFSTLYQTWIDNSLKKGFADFVIVAKNSQPEGFITAKMKKEKIVIGLFATDVNHRGKGIGSCLIQKIINIAAEKDLKVEVVTQSDNEVACRFYEKMGFEISDETYLYHIWNTNNS